MPLPFHCLLVGQRPSDLVEIADTARALAGRGHRATLLYLYASPEAEAHRSAFDALAGLADGAVAGVTPLTVDVLNVHAGVFERPRPVLALIDDAPTHAAGAVVETPVAPGLLAKVGRRVRDPKGTLTVLAEVGPAMFDLATRAPASLWGSLFTTARRMQDARLIYRRFHALFGRMIAEMHVDAVVIPEDIVGPVWPVLVSASHRAGIPALVCPYTLANQSEAIQSLKNEPAFQTSANAIAAHLHPSWRFHDDGIDIVRLPAEHILAHAELGISPADPWMMNSGFSDKVLVDSQASFDYFRAGGIPPEQMSITGSVSLDRMATLRGAREREMDALRTELRLSGSKPMLLISGCPDQLSAKVPFCEFGTMQELARSVGEALAPLAVAYHLVVRPHPNFERFGEMLAPFGIATATRSTASLVPLADVFIAFASATIRWAIACGIPTVNYDVFNYGYADFSAAKGVAAVNDSDGFRAVVETLAPGSHALNALRERAQHDMGHWGVMDGQGLDRIEQEIESARQQWSRNRG